MRHISGTGSERAANYLRGVIVIVASLVIGSFAANALAQPRGQAVRERRITFNGGALDDRGSWLRGSGAGSSSFWTGGNGYVWAMDGYSGCSYASDGGGLIC